DETKTDSPPKGRRTPKGTPGRSLVRAALVRGGGPGLAGLRRPRGPGGVQPETAGPPGGRRLSAGDKRLERLVRVRLADRPLCRKQRGRCRGLSPRGGPGLRRRDAGPGRYGRGGPDGGAERQLRQLHPPVPCGRGRDPVRPSAVPLCPLRRSGAGGAGDRRRRPDRPGHRTPSPLRAAGTDGPLRPLGPAGPAGMRGPAFPRRVRVGRVVFRDPLCTCALLYILLYFDSSGFLRLGLLAAALHECGHILVFALLFGRLPVVEVTMTGLCMRVGGARLTPGRRFVLAAAGPGMNALLA